MSSQLQGAGDDNRGIPRPGKLEARHLCGHFPLPPHTFFPIQSSGSPWLGGKGAGGGRGRSRGLFTLPTSFRWLFPSRRILSSRLPNLSSLAERYTAPPPKEKGMGGTSL